MRAETRSRRGAYPGSFDPPTVAHLAIAHRAVVQFDLRRVDLVVSRSPIGKEHVDRPLLPHRVAVLEQVASTRPWLGVVVTDDRLLVDIAQGYDVLVMGADKYHQLHDAGYYGSVAARDEALARLPRLAVAPRPPWPLPDGERLELGEDHGMVSSSGARAGESGWMVPEAAAFDVETGAWSAPDRYERWLRER